MRKLRVLKENAKYHVIARTNHRELLLDPADIKMMLIKVIQYSAERYDFELENFVIMGNHFHFLIKPGQGESLSKIMKNILQTFAMRYNVRTGSIGHFWSGRFFSWIIPDFWEYIRVFKYIDENPVRARLVREPGQWLFSGAGWRQGGLGHLVSQLPEWVLKLFPHHRPLAPL